MPSPNRRRQAIARCAALALASVACSDEAPRVSLVRIGGACGAAGDARTLILRALTDEGEVSRAVPAQAVAELADLPAATRQLSVEVLGAGGAVRVVGKTAPLSFGALGGGAQIPIAMAPPGGVCPTAAMLEPRVAPVVARAGQYVLVLGGQGAAGPLASAELYDPAADRFEPVALPPRLAAAGNFFGAVATALPDGRVALSGGPTGSYTVFDPQSKRFGPAIVLEPRVLHGAVALGGDAIFVAGGCRGATVTGACNGDAARPSFRLAIDSDAQEVLAALERDHVAPELIADAGLAAGLGAQTRGAGVLVIGASTATGLPAQTADRVDLVTGAAIPLAGTYASATALDSGAVLTGFAAAGQPPSDASSLLSAQLSVRALTGAPKLTGATLTLLEDGTALALGQGEGGPAAAIFHPGTGQWQPLSLPAEITALGQHRAVRVDDGSVLVVGAGTPGTPAGTAFRLRPSLTGPFAASVIAVPALESSAELTASSADAVNRMAGRYELVSTRSDIGAWTLVGGPRLVQGSLTAVVRPTLTADGEDGLAVITHFESPASALVTRLVPGAPVTVQRLGATAAELCRGGAAPALSSAAGPITLRFSARAGALEVRVNDLVALRCTVGDLPRGAWGLAVTGRTARVAIDTLTLER